MSNSNYATEFVRYLLKLKRTVYKTILIPKEIEDRLRTMAQANNRKFNNEVNIALANYVAVIQ